MNILSNGMESTLANWREFALLAWGETSPAVVFLDKNIAEKGPDQEVSSPENQMRMILSTIHDHNLVEKNRAPGLQVVPAVL